MGHRQGSAMAHFQPSLRPKRAFVVQVHAPPPGPSAADDARGEPVVSGQLARFQSLEELLAAMIHMLADVQAQSDSP